MKYTHAKFLQTLGATLALGSMAIACGADAAPPPGSGIAPASTGTIPPTSTTGAAVPTGTGAAVPTSTAPVPPPATGTPTTPVTTPTTAPTDTVAPTTNPTTPVTATTAEPDRPMPGQPTVGTPTTTTPTMTPTGGATVPPDVLPTMTPEEEEDPPVATGEGNALVPSDELWIAATTNGVGVVGSWYDFADKKSTVTSITAVDGVVCIAGNTGIKATDDDYGAGMGLNLNDEKEWDGSAYSGVSFTAEVTATDDSMIKVRFPMPDLADTGKEHFIYLKSGTNSISWSKLEQETWVEEPEDFDPSAILSMQIAVPANEDAENEFTICISDLVVDE